MSASAASAQTSGTVPNPGQTVDPEPTSSAPPSAGAPSQSTAPAPDTAEPASSTSGDIIVTAQRRSQSINNVGLAITALSGDQIARQGIADVRDLARIVPGLQFSESQKGAPIYTIRGVGFYEESLAASPAVSVYLDQIGYPFALMSRAASMDLERVEVLKGPQGTLYGQNATGGAVNYVAAKPTDRLSAGAEIGVNNFGGVGYTGFISGPVTGTLKARLAIAGDEGGAWQRSYTRNARNGDQDLIKARGMLEWTPTAGLNLTLTGTGFRDRSDTVAAALFRVTPQTPSRVTPAILAQIVAPDKPNTADWNPGANLDGKQNYYQISLQGKYNLLPNLYLSNITSYQHFDQDNFRDTDGSALDIYSVRQTGTIKSFFQELRLNGSFLGDRLDVGIGASYGRDRTNEDNLGFTALSTSGRAFVAAGLGTFSAVRTIDTQRMTTKAIFGNVEYKMTDNLSVLGGIRYTDYKNRFAGCSRDVDGVLAAGFTLSQAAAKRRLPGNPPVVPIARGECFTLNSTTFNPGLVTDTLAQDNVSWRAGVNFKPLRHTLLYITASRGYKSGSFPNLNATTSLSLKPVTQETVLAVEGGIKSDVLNWLHLDTSVFYYDYTNKQLRARVLDPSGVFGAVEALVNVPKSAVTGVEATARIHPAGGFTLTASGLYLDSRVKGSFQNFDPFGVAANFSGEAFPFSPKWSGNVDAEYQTDLGSDLSGFVGGNYSYQGRTSSAFGRSPLFTVKSYDLVDVRLGVSSPRQGWSVTVYAKNLFDKFYWTDTYRQIDNVARHIGMGRSYGVRLGYKF